MELKLMLDRLSQTFSLLTLIRSCHLWSPSKLSWISHIWWSCLRAELLTTLCEKDFSDCVFVFFLVIPKATQCRNMSTARSLLDKVVILDEVHSIFLWSDSDLPIICFLHTILFSCISTVAFDSGSSCWLYPPADYRLYIARFIFNLPVI